MTTNKQEKGNREPADTCDIKQLSLSKYLTEFCAISKDEHIIPYASSNACGTVNFYYQNVLKSILLQFHVWLHFGRAILYVLNLLEAEQEM